MSCIASPLCFPNGIGSVSLRGFIRFIEQPVFERCGVRVEFPALRAAPAVVFLYKIIGSGTNALFHTVRLPRAQVHRASCASLHCLGHRRFIASPCSWHMYFPCMQNTAGFPQIFGGATVSHSHVRTEPRAGANSLCPTCEKHFWVGGWYAWHLEQYCDSALIAQLGCSTFFDFILVRLLLAYTKEALAS